MVCVSDEKHLENFTEADCKPGEEAKSSTGSLKGKVIVLERRESDERSQGKTENWKTEWLRKTGGLAERVSLMKHS